MLASTLAPIFLTSFVGLILLLPGVLICSAIFKKELDFIAKFVIGCALGLGLLIYANVLLSVTTGINQTNLVVALILLYFASLLAAYKGGLRFPSGKRFSISKTQSLLLLVLLWSIVVRSLPLFFSVFPLGWDTTFHCLISKIVAMKGAIPSTWEPFEKIVLNYPWGSHVFATDISLLTGVEIHRVFAALVTIFFGVFSVLGVYLLSQRFFEEKLVAVLAALSYGFLANVGGLDYYRWGGLPNQVGMFLFLCVSYLLLGREISLYKRLVACGFLLGGIVLVHHHVMLTSFYILLFYGLIEAVSQRKVSENLKRVVLMIGLGLLFSSFFSWHFFERLFALQGTNVLKFQENLNIFGDSLTGLGLCLLIFGVVGFVHNRAKGSEEHIYLWSWLVSLLFAFSICYYVWKAITKFTYGQAFVAFTPSRFLTDMVYPLAVLSGLGVYVVVNFIRRRHPRLLLPFMIFLFLIPLQYVAPLCVSVIPKSVAQSMLWIRDNTPRSSLVVNDGQRSDWAPYLMERETTYVPLPISEYLNDYRNRKMGFAFEVVRVGLEGGHVPSQLLSDFWGRKVYIHTEKSLKGDFLRELWRFGNVRIYEVRSLADLKEGSCGVE